jgi:SAM-dependent methyltransferase
MTPVSKHEGNTIVRTASVEPTPFLRSQSDFLERTAVVVAGSGRIPRAIDLGCGNGRNSKYLQSLGYDVLSFDLKPDYGLQVDLTKQFPAIWRQSVDVVLLQYVLMFLPPEYLGGFLRNVIMTCKSGAVLVIELFNAKDSYYTTKEQLAELERRVLEMTFYSNNVTILYQKKNKLLLEIVKT